MSLSQPPPQLEWAIQSASRTYGVPPDVLEGIWRVESASTFPNRAVNPSGYGGLFGTKEWNAPTLTQANYAASTLANLWGQTGSLSAALSKYSGGGYSSVPGETTPGSAAPSGDASVRAALAGQHHGLVTFNPGFVPGGQSVVNAAKGAYSSVTDALGSIAGAARFVFSYRFLKLLAGAALVLTALFLLVKPQAA